MMTMLNIVRKSAFIVVLMLLVLPVSVQGQGATDDDVNAIAKKLYCPVCENIPLDTCGTAACEQWREEIRTQLNEGRTEQQIIDDFVVRFGQRVVGTPQDPILRALSLVTPWILGAIVLAVAIYVFIRWRNDRQSGLGLSPAGGSNPPGGASPLSDDDYRTRLEGDVKERY